MRVIRYFLIVATIVSLAALVVYRVQRPGTSVEGAAPQLGDDPRDLDQLRRVSDRTFVHGPTRVSFIVPPGWTATEPQRLERQIDRRASSVLRIDWPERETTASLSWVALNAGEKVTDWVREEPAGGEYGEEYETLRAVYGRDQVTVPRRVAHGTFTVYRINYFIPQDGTDRFDGAVLLLPVEAGGTTWLLKARISYPKADRGRRDEYIQAVLKGYGREPQ
jgi:hypothetical protein